MIWGRLVVIIGKFLLTTDILKAECAHRYLKCCSGKALECQENSWELNYRTRSFLRWVIFSCFFMYWLRSRRQWLATAGDFGKWTLEPGASICQSLGPGRATGTYKSPKQARGVVFWPFGSLFCAFSGAALVLWCWRMQALAWSFDLQESRLRRSRWPRDLTKTRFSAAFLWVFWLT